MKSPQISVIMPVHNAELYLKESIDSILNQSFRNFEFIIIEDGSSDNSKKIIEGFKRKDRRIKLIRNKKNLGLQKTLNKGLKLAKGDYIAIIDADDISFSDRFQKQINFLEKNPKIFLVGGSAIVIDENGQKIGVLKKYDNYKKIKKKLRKTNPIIHPSIMFRNTGGLFYREKFKTSEDYDIYLVILTSGKKITNLSDFILKYRISKNSFVSTMPNQEFYFNKAKEFYSQRLKYGQDKYDSLIPPKKNHYPKDIEKVSLKSKIFLQLSDGKAKNVRRNVREYVEKYGFEKDLAFYYLLSFFPKQFIHFLKRYF